MTVRELPNGPERRHLQHSIDINAGTALTYAAREARPGSELYPLRHARHPLLRQCARLLAIAFTASIVYDLLACKSMTQAQIHRAYWIDGALLAMLIMALIVIWIGQRRREKWLKARYNAAAAKLDSISPVKLEKLRHLYTFKDERPGVSCGCLECMKLFTTPDDSSFDVREVRCPCCGGYNIIYGSSKVPLTPESLFELHDFINKE